MAVEPVVQTRELTKRYGPVVAVDGLSLSVPGGQGFGLLGPNGSGKTTTLGLLLGLVRPTAGSVRLFGLNTNGAQHGAVGRVSTIVETPSFYPHLSARDNLRYLMST